MRYLLILYLLVCSFFSFSQQNSFVKKLPDPYKAVNDFAGFLSGSERNDLEIELKNYLDRSANAIVIVTLESLTDPKTKKEYTIEEAALLYFNTWGIGDRLKNNGVLLLVSRNPRRIRIEVGTGLETVLDDAFCKDVIDNTIVPAFKNGNYFTGFNEAITALENKIGNKVEDLPAPQPVAKPLRSTRSYVLRSNESEGGEMAKNFFVIIVGIVGALIIIVLIVALSKESDGYYSRHGYNRRQKYWRRHRHRHGHKSSNSKSSWSSFSSRSSSSSSSSYGGGRSRGGGASGSW